MKICFQSFAVFTCFFLSAFQLYADCALKLKSPTNNKPVILTGVLSSAGVPCHEEPCMPCLVPVLKSDEITYYFNGLDEYEVSERLNANCYDIEGDSIKVEGFVFSEQGDWIIEVNNLYRIEHTALEEVPAEELLNISGNILTLKDTDVNAVSAIFSADGWQVMSFTGGTADISTLPQGLYVLRATAANGKNLTAKFVK